MTHITLNLVADSAADLRQTISELAGIIANTTSVAEAINAAQAEKPAELKKERAKAEPKKPEPKAAPTATEAAGSTETETSAPADASTDPAPSAEPQPDTSSAETTSADTAAVTYADVQAAVTRLASATGKGRDAVLAVFEQFGVDHGSKLSEEQWPEAIALLDQAREG
ncbi:hypothetical protein BSL82_10035 [Tardibacter chloracetimidivorans]|uniref:Uncharacterized protein n=1 Tax=Tardibacter chloracetimidivorans TaxID=1921510 RepID=A0A1L3ZVF0_9SPHN|nr:hypothetical protein [Tardibacter chloracetimidivorans]API59612.1 hypothetical protein BSL82_10035 [Tardibacter chloracetimidivorans]